MKKLMTTATALAIFMVPLLSFAEEAHGGGEKGGLFYIAKALAIGLAAIGGALGQGKLVSSALEGIARNPGAAGQIQTPMILGIAFVESLVIFALVIAFTM
jgi:F-type H+-transporting ATPase subunit c